MFLLAVVLANVGKGNTLFIKRGQNDVRTGKGGKALERSGTSPKRRTLDAKIPIGNSVVNALSIWKGHAPASAAEKSFCLAFFKKRVFAPPTTT